VLPKPVGVQAILTLAWLDPIAALFGVKFGRTPWSKIAPQASEIVRNKTFEGSLAGFLAAFLAGAIAWTGPWAAVPTANGLYWPPPMVIAGLSVFGGVSAVLAEALPSQWDDNATIPFWTGIAVWFAAAVIGVPMTF
jgi:dolichol kinase